jgi:hypothetical protein
VELPTPGYQPSENNHRARSNLRSVSHHHHPPDHLHSAHLPQPTPNYRNSKDSSRLSLADEHSGHLSRSYPVSHDHHSSHQHHHEHQQQQHETPQHSGHLSHSNPVSHDHHSSHQHHHHQQHETPQHFGHLSHSNPVSHDHHSSHHHQHQQHQHNHHHNHHNHERVVETYDPRWWYMPVNHVHSPKSLRLPEYHYLPPKWYESPRTYGKILKNANELRLPPRKYIDCQCHVCKPPQRHIHGVKWVVNQ